MTENEVSYLIRGAIFRVSNKLGPGLLESAYETALAFEINKAGLHVLTQMPLPFVYESVRTDVGYRLDLLVEDIVIVEIKSVECLLPVHHKQLLTYLKLSGLRLGLLVNFNAVEIGQNIFRKVNNFPADPR